MITVASRNNCLRYIQGSLFPQGTNDREKEPWWVLGAEVLLYLSMGGNDTCSGTARIWWHCLQAIYRRMVCSIGALQLADIIQDDTVSCNIPMMSEGHRICTLSATTRWNVKAQLGTSNPAAKHCFCFSSCYKSRHSEIWAWALAVGGLNDAYYPPRTCGAGGEIALCLRDIAIPLVEVLVYST